MLEFADLQRVSGYDRRADVERWARDIGLSVRPCRGGVWTTVEALNAALGLLASNDDAYPAGVV
ncbi:hypothetical protein [Lysobacter sp. HA35]